MRGPEESISRSEGGVTGEPYKNAVVARTLHTIDGVRLRMSRLRVGRLSDHPSETRALADPFGADLRVGFEYGTLGLRRWQDEVLSWYPKSLRWEGEDQR